jgi:hypothetical protein
MQTNGWVGDNRKLNEDNWENIRRLQCFIERK